MFLSQEEIEPLMMMIQLGRFWWIWGLCKNSNLNTDLIKKFGIILKTTNSRLEFSLGQFVKYCKETALLYRSYYDSYYMPVSVHQSLIHGIEIISNFCVTIRILSEELQEALNKDYKYNRSY